MTTMFLYIPIVWCSSTSVQNTTPPLCALCSSHRNSNQPNKSVLLAVPIHVNLRIERRTCAQDESVAVSPVPYVPFHVALVCSAVPVLVLVVLAPARERQHRDRGRQTDRQTHRQTDRQTDRQRERDRERQRGNTTGKKKMSV